MTHEKYRYSLPVLIILFFFSVMQTDSEYESDVSSITDSSTNEKDQSKMQYEHLVKRLDSLTQENRVLQMEVQTYKLRLKSSQQEIKQLKQFVIVVQFIGRVFSFVVKVFISK